jgi:hypothetical protein
MKRHIHFIFLATCVISLAGLLSHDTTAQKQTPARHAYDSGKPLPEPTLFGEGIISTPEDELNAAFAPDGNSVYFCKNIPVNRQGVILVSNFVKGKWTPPEVAPFSGRFSDYDPFFSHDGSQIFFVSNRPTSGDKPKDYDVWMVLKTANGWGEPKNLGAPVNTATDEFYPSVASDGTLYFSAVHKEGKGGFDLYRSRFAEGKYDELENLGEANSPSAEIDSYIAPDQSFIVFASYGRPDDMGRGDLYISYNQNGKWGKAECFKVERSSGMLLHMQYESDNKRYVTKVKPPSQSYTTKQLTCVAVIRRGWKRSGCGKCE